MRQRSAQYRIPPTGRVLTAVTHPSESSAGQANSPPGEVSTVVNLPSQGSAVAQKDTGNLRGRVPTAVTNPSEDSVAQANDRLPGQVSTVVTLLSRDSARWSIGQKNAARGLGNIPTAVTNPSERPAGQTNRLPGKALTAVALLSSDYTGWAIAQKNAVQNIRAKTPTVVYSPGEDSEGRVVVRERTAKCLSGNVLAAVARPEKNSASQAVEWVVVR